MSTVKAEAKCADKQRWWELYTWWPLCDGDFRAQKSALEANKERGMNYGLSELSFMNFSYSKGSPFHHPFSGARADVIALALSCQSFPYAVNLRQHCQTALKRACREPLTIQINEPCAPCHTIKWKITRCWFFRVDVDGAEREKLFNLN